MLLFRVVSTPGVRKSLYLSVCFSAVPLRGGQHPRPFGVTPALPPLCIGLLRPTFYHATCAHRPSPIVPYPSYVIPHHSSFVSLPVFQKEEKCYHFVTSLLLERWKPLCLRPFRHLWNNPTRILTLFFDRFLNTFGHLWRIFCHHLASLATPSAFCILLPCVSFLPSVTF